MTRSSEERVEGPAVAAAGLQVQQQQAAAPQPPSGANNARARHNSSQQHQQHQHQHQQQQQQQTPTSATADHNKPKRNPFCSRCRNHGKIAQVKGHKRHCDYRNCQCEGCKLVECRQIVSARQIKLRRYQKQDEEYGRRIEVSPPVLRRPEHQAPGDPVALVASTLIGAAAAAAAASTGGLPQVAAAAGLRGPFKFPPTTVTGGPTQCSATQQSSGDGGGVGVGVGLAPGNLLYAPAGAAALANRVLPQHQPPPQPLPAPAPPAPPSFQEQISWVEEIHYSYGLLALYAWLRAEHFNLQKVRDLIELSKGSFDELLQLTGHSPLDLTNPIVD